jgi:putative membrane protein
MSFDRIDDKIMHRVMRLVGHVLARGRLRIAVTGLHHVPAHGPAILVARHYHHLFDGIALHWAIPRRIHLVVTLDWATNSFTRFSMEALIRAARWPLVLRADARARQSRDTESRGTFAVVDLNRYRRKAVHDSIALLREGRLLVIFPEGYPNVDPHYTPKTREEEMLPFKSGFAAVAAAAEKRLNARLPLIPVGFHYTPGEKWTARVSFGAPQCAGDFVSRKALVRKFERDVAMLSNLSPRGENDRSRPSL